MNQSTYTNVQSNDKKNITITLVDGDIWIWLE